MRLPPTPSGSTFPRYEIRPTTRASFSNSRPLQEDDKPFEVRLSDESFETYELDPPPYTLQTTKRELKQMYYDMASIR